MLTIADHSLWHAPHRMRRYQYHKILGALVIIMIFVGWLVILWSNVFIRFLSIGLLVVTGLVLICTILSEVRQGRNRQLAITGGGLLITTAEGCKRVALETIVRARWRDEPIESAGMWFYDGQEKVLAHLDKLFLADQAEARIFLHWARRRGALRLQVQWPAQLD